MFAENDDTVWEHALRVRCSEADCNQDTFFHYNSPNWFTNAEIGTDGAETNAIFASYYSTYVNKVKLVIGTETVVLDLKAEDKGLMTLRDLATKDGRLADTTNNFGIAIDGQVPMNLGQDTSYSKACSHWGTCTHLCVSVEKRNLRFSCSG